MEPQIELGNAEKEVQRKIGRNVLLFQQMEYLLKFLIANGNEAGYLSELKANKEKRAEVINKKTLGLLVGDYVEKIFSQNGGTPAEPKKLTEPYININVRMEVDENFYETKKEALAAMVANRNELIHNFLSRFDPNSIESCQKAEQFLDQQRDKLIPEIKLLKDLAKQLHNFKQYYAAFINSFAGKLSFLLDDIAAQESREDGWTLLPVAGDQLKKRFPDLLNELYQETGHKKLKNLILESGLYDIKEECTGKGGLRLLFRPKPAVSLDVNRLKAISHKCKDGVADS